MLDNFPKEGSEIEGGWGMTMLADGHFWLSNQYQALSARGF